MLNVKKVLLHCKENEREYERFNINPSDPGRLVNKGWIEALEFVNSNFDAEYKTIKE